MVACSSTGYKTFLVCCNVALLFVGVSLLVLGVKMEGALAALLMDAPPIAKTFKAVTATGFFVSVAGIIGIAGSCYEILWLIAAHLFFLAAIVVLEFALGVTLVVIRTTIENYIESPDCNNSCAATLDAVVLDYAVPSSGLMMTVIIVEALMIYTALKLYVLLRDAPKLSGLPERVLRTLQVPVSPSTFSTPAPALLSASHRSADWIRSHARRPPQRQSAGYSPKPPDYARVVPEQLPPPPYLEVVHPSSSPSSQLCDFPRVFTRQDRTFQGYVLRPTSS